jgi:hypothetical protein
MTTLRAFTTASLALIGLISTRPAAAQTVAPQVTSISLVSPTSLEAGSQLEFNYTLAQGSNAISDVFVVVQDSNGHTYSAFNSSGSATGIISTTTGTSWLNGTYTVSEVFVSDTLGYTTYYYSDGSIYYAPGSSGPDVIPPIRAA